MASLKLPNLKIPRVLPKKPIIKGIDNATLAGGVAVTIMAGVYYAQQQGWIQLPYLGGVLTEEQVETADEGGTQTGHRIAFVVSPTTAIEGANILISGNITDSNGLEYKAPNLYYYVYQELEGGVLKTVTTGQVSTGESQFRKIVSLTGLRPGDYKVRVSEELLPSSGAIQPGATDIAGQNPPNITNLLEPSIGGNITLS